MDLTEIEDTHISLAHGNGGRYMRELISAIFARHLSNPLLDTDADAVTLPSVAGEVMVSTDGFTVQPLEFPGGDVGSLAIHGTTNDLAVAGAEPKYLTLNAFIEEGLEIALLDRLIGSLGAAAAEIGVAVVAGDTKVLRRGEGSGLYLATAGVGYRDPGLDLGMRKIQAGDHVLVSGPVGDHGISVMMAREAFGLSGNIVSDAASVLPLTRAALKYGGLRFMRDPTRGGLASVCHEIAAATDLTVRLQESAVPIRDEVQGVCDMLGYDPYYLACEGRVVAVVSPDQADALLRQWQSLGQGESAARIGVVEAGEVPVILETSLGGERMLQELEDDPLPRIC
ncbi:MAG: hydrogenase expression/formation protein HypE [bacterium]